MDKSTMLIISFLVGALGVDRFLLGDTLKGVLKLITGGGFGIWWLYDIFQIYTGKLAPEGGYE